MTPVPLDPPDRAPTTEQLPSEQAPSEQTPMTEQAAIDPDLDVAPSSGPPDWHLVTAVALGGVLGAEARYGLGLLVPHGAAQFPWSTLLINGTGSFALGALLAVLAVTRPNQLIRPFAGSGILGGYTTFSTFAVDTDRLLRLHRPALAFEYVATTLAVCALAVWVGTACVRTIATRRSPAQGQVAR